MAKKKQEEAPKGSPAWMATFSDLMNLLLCFFVLLFSMSSIEVSKFEEIAASLNSSFSSTLNIFDNVTTDSILENDMFPKNVEQVDDAKQYQADTTKEDSKNQEDGLDVGEVVKKEQEKAATKLYDEVAKYTEKAQLDKQVEVVMDNQYQYVKLTLSGAVVFNSGEATIKKEAKVILSRIGNILKNYQNNIIKIEGHSDNVPIKRKGKYNDNMELSYARAYEVWKYMTEEKNLPPETLEASGRSQYNPVADNKTAAGRAKNRRVEFKIYTDLNN